VASGPTEHNCCLVNRRSLKSGCIPIKELDDPIELVEAVIADDELAFAWLRVLQLDLGAEPLAQIALELPDVWIWARARFFFWAVRLSEEAFDECFGLTHWELFLCDERGYFMTGPDLYAEADRSWWPLARDPLFLESSQPGLFIAGDVRHGSIKRVASAVGEGATSISLVHSYLRTLNGDRR
jgi:hypothetical protein